MRSLLLLRRCCCLEHIFEIAHCQAIRRHCVRHGRCHRREIPNRTTRWSIILERIGVLIAGSIEKTRRRGRGSDDRRWELPLESVAERVHCRPRGTEIQRPTERMLRQRIMAVVGNQSRCLDGMGNCQIMPIHQSNKIQDQFRRKFVRFEF